MKRSINDDSACTSKRTILRSNFNKFDWKNLCFICEKRKTSHTVKLSIVSENSNVRNNVLKAAIIRNDTTVQERVETQDNLCLVEARYHLYCYQTYINQRLLNSFKKCGGTEVSENVGSTANEQMDESMSNDNITYDDVNSTTFHDEVTRITIDFYKEKFQAGEVIVFSDICKTYRQEMKKRGNCNIVQSSWIKSQLLKICGDSLTFYTQPGVSDIVYSSTISTGYILHKLMKSTKENTKDVDDSTCISESNENIVLHRAAQILRKYIAEIPETKNYPQPHDVCLESSKKFVPEQLQKFISWIMDEPSFVNSENLSDRDESAQRRMLTLSECLIYCSRRGRCQVIPPFHYGLMCQLFHEFGSKTLIETLNAYGFCSTYDELRMLLTAVATREIERNKTVYVPSGIIHVQDGGLFIQEGDDNVDMNTETIDGKNTYHAMARVLFQNQTMHQKIKSQTTPIPRQKEKSLSSDTNVLLKLLTFNKPPKRPEPLKYSNVHNIIESKLTNYEALTAKDITWVLLRSLSRGLFDNANINTQSIPSWVAFNTFFGKQKETVTVAQYIPAINEKPSNVNTVYTTLKHGQNLVKECGQTYQVHTFDQQLYATAQEVKFASLPEFPTLIVRIGGFHTVCDFISCIKKLWGDCGIRDMLVESGIYAANTVDRMLEGKQFHRAVRGLTLCFEVLSTLMFESFLDSISEHDNDVILNVIEKCNEFRKKFATDKSNCSPDSLHELIKQIESIMIPFNNYRKERCNESPTFQYWDYCLQSLQILLQCIRAERESNWQLHLTTIIAMLPYFFACDKCNYSRWATLYVVEMLNLPEEVETEFLNGHFTINFTTISKLME